MFSAKSPAETCKVKNLAVRRLSLDKIKTAFQDDDGDYSLQDLDTCYPLDGQKPL